jgi:Xaa-Pro aminopeptidase
MNASLPAMDVAGRVRRLRERLPAAGCEALLVTSLTNIRYLTGFSGSAAMLLVRPDKLLFITDGRYREQSGEQLAAAGVDARVHIGSTAADQRRALGAAVGDRGALGLEAAAVSWAEQRRLAEELPVTELVPTEDLVEDLRRTKDRGEVARIEAAAHAADGALAAVLPMIVAGATEREVALALEVEMRTRGATGPAFETIVAAGSNGAKPHARPSTRAIERGELVVIDFGATVDGYRSDMTRTLCAGRPRSDVSVRMVDVVAESQRAGVAAVAAGVDCRDVDRACRTVIVEAGWGEAFVHGTGHGVGLDIHENPRVASSSEAVLVAGDVVTVEPGVYLPEHGGVRIEDTVVVTDDGCRPLTRAPKDLVLT